MSTYEPGIIMTPEHPRWGEFCERLTEYLNSIGGCDGVSLTGSGIVLAEMKVWEQGSIEFFREHGGFCDCEVLMNVAYVRLSVGGAMEIPQRVSENEISF